MPKAGIEKWEVTAISLLVGCGSGFVGVGLGVGFSVGTRVGSGVRDGKGVGSGITVGVGSGFSVGTRVGSGVRDGKGVGSGITVRAGSGTNDLPSGDKLGTGYPPPEAFKTATNNPKFNARLICLENDKLFSGKCLSGCGVILPASSVI
jgi:hypothetical protein